MVLLAVDGHSIAMNKNYHAWRVTLDCITPPCILIRPQIPRFTARESFVWKCEKVASQCFCWSMILAPKRSECVYSYYTAPDLATESAVFPITKFSYVKTARNLSGRRKNIILWNPNEECRWFLSLPLVHTSTRIYKTPQHLTTALHLTQLHYFLTSDWLTAASQLIDSQILVFSKLQLYKKFFKLQRIFAQRAVRRVTLNVMT